jgi:hypothetical protein
MVERSVKYIAGAPTFSYFIQRDVIHDYKIIKSIGGTSE